MAGALTIQRGSHAFALMVIVVVLSWKECFTQQEHLAFQSSCKPENNSKATNTCIEQGMRIFSINDFKVAGNFKTEAEAQHGSIWISDYADRCRILRNGTFVEVNSSEQHYYLCKRNATVEEELSRNDYADRCRILRNGTFVEVNCSEQHYYLCKRNATVEEELSRNDTRAFYVPCQRNETSMPPQSSTTTGTPGTKAATTTTSSDSKGLSNTAIYLIVAVAVCFVVVCIVAAVVIKRCTAKKQENVTLKRVDVVREKNEGVALTENGGNSDDTPM
ncbi:uncharacterized protein [Haliotis asinina]|uniref:uncharacterized protein n=1 Tax=Haliotis asinina TaxID=109174 RepID=UPI003531DD53